MFAFVGWGIQSHPVILSFAFGSRRWTSVAIWFARNLSYLETAGITSMAKHRYRHCRRKTRKKHGGSQNKRNIRCADYPRPPAGLPPEHVRNDPTRQLTPGAYVDNEKKVPGAYVDLHLLVRAPETVMGAPNPLLICGSPKPWWDAESCGDSKPGSS